MTRLKPPAYWARRIALARRRRAWDERLGAWWGWARREVTR